MAKYEWICNKIDEIVMTFEHAFRRAAAQEPTPAEHGSARMAARREAHERRGPRGGEISYFEDLWGDAAQRPGAPRNRAPQGASSVIAWSMLNWISRAESILTHGPWWWRPIGTAIIVALLALLYFALG